MNHLTLSNSPCETRECGPCFKIRKLRQADWCPDLSDSKFSALSTDLITRCSLLSQPDLGGAYTRSWDRSPWPPAGLHWFTEAPYSLFSTALGSVGKVRILFFVAPKHLITVVIRKTATHTQFQELCKTLQMHYVIISLMYFNLPNNALEADLVTFRMGALKLSPVRNFTVTQLNWVSNRIQCILFWSPCILTIMLYSCFSIQQLLKNIQVMKNFFFAFPLPPWPPLPLPSKRWSFYFQRFTMDLHSIINSLYRYGAQDLCWIYNSMERA